MKNKKLLSGLCLSIFLSGCSLMPDDKMFTTIGVSDNDYTEAADNSSSGNGNNLESEYEVVIDQPSFSDNEEIFGEYETVAIKDLEEPIDENGEWTDYTMFSNKLEIEFEGCGENGSRFVVENYPFILTKDEVKQKELEEAMWPQLSNKVTERFLIYNIDIMLECKVMNDTRFVSYELAGKVYHTGDDDRFEDEIEYRYYANFDRMTGQVINLETAIGVLEAYNQIRFGEYEVVRANASVFKKFSNELLADIYVNNPIFEDDTDHTLDFYIHDGHVYVVIWVGEDNGNYAIFKLNKPSKL